jgi:Leucine Rich repeat
MPIPKSVRELIEKKSEKITHINLSNCGLNDNDMVELQELLEQNTYINSIDLSDNNITEIGCFFLSTLKITQLNLKNNHVQDKGVESLLRNSCIKELDLSKNGLTDSSAQSLLENINKYTQLSVIGNPDISDSLLKNIYSHFSVAYSNSPTSGIDVGKNITSFLTKNTLLSEKKETVSQALAEKLIETYTDETKSKNFSNTDIQNAVKSFCNYLGMEIEIKTYASSISDEPSL